MSSRNRKKVIGMTAITLAAWMSVEAQEPVNLDKQTAKQEASAPIRSTTRLVQLSVVVTDKSGAPVSGLKKEDFSVLDEGRPQEIAFFSGQLPPAVEAKSQLPPNVFTNRYDLLGEDPGAVTIVLFDSLNTAVEDQAHVRSQVIKFLKSLKPQDHVAIYGLTNELLILHEFSQDSSALVTAAAQFKPNQKALYDASHPEYFDVPAMIDAHSGWQRFQDAVNQENARVADQYKMRRAEMTSNAFQAIANHVAMIPGRKNVVWVSGSFPFSIIVESLNAPDRVSDTTGPYAEAAARALNRANIAVYPVDATGLEVNAAMDPSNGIDYKCMDCTPEAPGPKSGMFVREERFATERNMAAATGGQAFIGTNDVTGAVKRAFDDGRYAYTIAFYPNHGQWNGAYRKVKVELKEPGWKLRYRAGYFAEPEHVDSESKGMAALQDAAASPLDATNLGMIVSRKPGEPGDRNIEVHVGLDPRQLMLQHADQRWSGAVTLYFVQRDDNGASLAAESQKIGLNLEEKQYEYLCKAGLVLGKHVRIETQAVELRVLVRDSNSGALGSVIVRVAAWLAPGGTAAENKAK